ncbi:hypothetical protein [Ruegeria sp.]|uniref:hypothetical protein n=1 Tax=Ruegeria sp. TaxID=1879320 RepID=UPI003C7DE63A
MIEIVAEIESKVSNCCKVNTIRRGNFKVDISKEVYPWIIIDFDMKNAPLNYNQTKPDFLFVSSIGGLNNSGRVIPIEISKGRSKSAEKIRNQLQAGSDWAHKVMRHNFQPKLIPLYCGLLSKSTRRNLKSCRIKFRGQKVIPRIVSRNASLPKQ